MLGVETGTKDVRGRHVCLVVQCKHAGGMATGEGFVGRYGLLGGGPC